MKSKTRTKLAYLAIAVLAVAGIAYWMNGNDVSGEVARTIETVAVDRGDITRSVATSGSVRPLITVEVGSQLSGQLAEIHADFNTPVKKGQIIALIDSKTFETRVLQNQADLRVAESNVIVQQAGIDRAKANLRKARLEYERAEPLSKQGTMSAQEFESALAAYESARAEVTMAEAQLENAMASREQRRASLESAQIDLERTKIRSPIDGVVIERAVDQGQTVAASLSSPVLFNIAQDLTEIQIEANVDEADIGNVRAGNQATFTVDAYPGSEFSGQVGQVRLAPNEQNNVVTYTVIITARNPDLKLLPGMTAIVEIITGKSEDVLRVPNQAVRFNPPAGSELAALSPSSESGRAGSGSPGGSQGGGMRGLRDISQLSESLGLDETQESAIKSDLQKLFSEMRGRSQGGDGPDGDMAALRDQMRKSVAEVFKRHLSAEQYREYQKARRDRQETRPGQLWIQDSSGDIKPVAVRLGISDDNFTQISGKNIEEGDLAVSRMRSASR
jgi:HlyD family secretion protein